MCKENGMRRLRRHTLWLLLIVFIGVGALAVAAYGAPNKCKAPLDIFTPVYAGTRVIGYEHGTAGCPVYVYADGKPVQLARKNPHVSCTGWGAVYLSRPLKLGETITAKQDPAGYATAPKKAPQVKDIPSSFLISRKLKPPTIMPPIVACQTGVRVKGLVEGARASVTNSGLIFDPQDAISGSMGTPYAQTYVPVGKKLKAGFRIESNQDIDNTSVLASDYSTPPTTVKKLPPKLPYPIIKDDIGDDGIPDVLVGAQTLTVCDLWVGALIDVYSVDKTNTQQRVGGGTAINNCNVVAVEPLKKGLKYYARQSLCKLKSKDPKEKDFVVPTNSINIPKIREPLCEGDIDVIVDKTADTSMVWIQVNSKGKIKDKGNVTAQGSTTVVPVMDGVPLKTGDSVRVRQDNESLDSGWSKQWVVVESKTSQRCEDREGTPTPSTPPATVCTPGTHTGQLTLWRQQDNCQDNSSNIPPTHAYHGDTTGDKGAVLQKIINTSSDFRIKIVKEFNPKNPTGSLGPSCTAYGSRCNYKYSKVIYTIEPNGSWDNINESCWPFKRIYACLERVTPVKKGEKEFPLTVDIDYEYECK